MENILIYKNNTTYTDFTKEVNNYYSNNANAIGITAAEDYLYIGSRMPLNHLFFKFGTVNTASSVLTIAIWDGSNWRNVSKTYDETSLSGATFGQNGFITWVPNRTYGWGREDTQDSSGNELITGLGDVNIYDHYWIRLAFSLDLDAGTTIAWIGQKFADDNDLGSEYPDLVLSATMTSWESGKTSWEEQHIKASRFIVDDLITRKMIIDKGQILEREDFKSACVSKVAEMAYRAMGPRFIEDKKDAKNEYLDRIGRQIGTIDKDKNAIIDNNELNVNIQGKLYR